MSTLRTKTKTKPQAKKLIKVKKSTYILLVFFLGTWGIHKFFVDKIFQGTLLLILFTIPFAVFCMECVIVFHNPNQSFLDYLINGLDGDQIPTIIAYILKILYLTNTLWVIIDAIQGIRTKPDPHGYIRL